MSHRIVFFGNERLVSGLDHTDTPILNGLIDAGYDIVAVVVNDAGTKSRKQKVLEVAELAAKNDIPVLSPERPMDICDQLASYQAEAAVLVAYGRIIPQKLIDLFPFGIINVHPSRLPAYRGPSPIESTLVNGDESTAVSIMSLEAKMDAGPVYSQLEVQLSGTETAPELAHDLADQAANEIIRLLPRILDGSLKPTKQDDSNATYCQIITKDDARLDPEKHTAIQAERMVRAYLAFPRARIRIANNDIIVTKAHLTDSANSPLQIPFVDGILSVDELIAPSGKRMSADAFIRGYLEK